jgi:hypothetical protein
MMNDEWDLDLFPQQSPIVLVAPTTSIVHPKDQDFIDWLFELAKESDEPGPWIAGGAPLRWYMSDPATTDIDMFFSSEWQWNKFKQNLVENMGSIFDPNVQQKLTLSGPPHQSKNAWTYEIVHNNINYKLQLVKKDFFESAEAVINRFDISVCQIAIDGKDKVTVGDWFARDVAARQFRLNEVTDSTVPRVIKYMCYGFEPVDSVKDTVLNSDQSNWVVRDDYHAF